MKLVVGDYANIEGRLVAWLAGEEWKLQAFRDYDTILGYDDKGKAIRKGHDLYNISYARAFGIPVEDVEKHQRQIGKVMELMLGYGGGVGAFITGAATYGIDLDDMAVHALPEIPMRVYLDAQQFWFQTLRDPANPLKTPKFANYGLEKETFIACDSLKRLWREAHMNVQQFWWDLESAVTEILRDRGGGMAVGRLWVDMKGNWLRIRLPSGRYLCYPGAQLKGGKITYMGQHQYTRQWTRLSTYGGKLVENVTQAVARDILCDGLINTDKAGYPGVLHVHDEIVAEVQEDQPLDKFLEVMSQLPPWATGLPLAVAGFETKRYRKE